MNSTIINAGNAKYLADVMTSFPDNSIVNKTITGCGATTVAITNDEKYVICVPSVMMIKNKMAQHSNLLGVYAGVSVEDIKAYTGDKIMVTYDSLPKVVEAIDTSQYKILIDEAHQIVIAGAFRAKAVRRVLNNFSKFKAFCFITATLVKRQYIHPSIADIPMYTIIWDNIEPVNLSYTVIDTEQNKSLTKEIAYLCYQYMEGKLDGNPYFFFNSVKGICNIISTILESSKLFPNVNISSKDIKIVCSDNDTNDAVIDKYLGSSFMIDSLESAGKKLTFLTSTVFEGADIYDENGVTYIVSDGKKEHTKYDILTMIPQIIGRIRDSKHRNRISAIFTPSPYYNSIDESVFEQHIKKSLVDAEEFVSVYNATPDTSDGFKKVRATLKAQASHDAYMDVSESDDLIVNYEAKYAEMHRYEAVHKTYYVNRDSQRNIVTGTKDVTINNCPYTIEFVDGEFDTDNILDSIKTGSRINFRKLCEMYISEMSDSSVFKMKSYAARQIEAIEPLVKEAYEAIGGDKMKALKFIKKDIIAEMTAVSELNDIAKIFNLLDTFKYKTGTWVSKKDIKHDINTIHRKLGIKKAAKATDIKRYFNCKATSKRVDSVMTQGFLLLDCKFKISK